ncbi:hypothetical protein [Ruminococcus sp. YE71]|uniref:hypothetical protein n=1 Tax=Ruminococcus sp. YE71 TaxID=244362 RepID=UPI000A9F1CC6|nr:hypothetical protein [Ruminococcus sp. YE71]
MANRDEQYEHDDNVCTDYELFFSSLDDLAGYLIENRNGSESILFESESQLKNKNPKR